MNITITENEYECIASVRDGEAPLALWARHDHSDWAFLGYMADDGRYLRTRIDSRDIESLAAQIAPLDKAFYAYAADQPRQREDKTEQDVLKVARHLADLDNVWYDSANASTREKYRDRADEVIAILGGTVIR